MKAIWERRERGEQSMNIPTKNETNHKHYFHSTNYQNLQNIKTQVETDEIKHKIFVQTLYKRTEGKMNDL